MSHPNLNFHNVDEAIFNVALSLPQTGYNQKLIPVNIIEKNDMFSVIEPNKLEFDKVKKEKPRNISIICSFGCKMQS